MPEGAKQNKMLEIALLKASVKQFRAPPRKKFKDLTSWTLRPPAASVDSSPSAIGVLLQGQFYVASAGEARIAKTNKELGASYKVRLRDFQDVMGRIFPCFCCLHEANKNGGVTVAWGKSIVFA